MLTIENKITSLRDKLLSNNNEVNSYKILSNFKGTYIEKQMLKEESIVDPIFRVFIPYKPERQRNINISPENDFDPYIDSLMDYPTIIGHMMEQPWELYNRLISIQVPRCINECWHCYLPTNLFNDITLTERTTELTARQIIDKFYLQKKMDALAGKKTNVLRITGGEPFQLPSLILECLDILKQDRESNFEEIDVLNDIKGTDKIEDYKYIFLWTETNLTPFISVNDEPAFMDRPENVEILRELAGHKNFLVHPCFHGLDEEEYKNITLCGNKVTFDDLIQAIKKLHRCNDDEKINIYPTFGSNVSNPNNLLYVFQKLYDVDKTLPLRTALVEYKTDYEPISERLQSSRRIDLYSRFANLRIWNLLLQKTYGIGYGTIPRHLVISNDNSHLPHINPIVFSDTVYLFKGSFRDLYHREVLDIMAYPNNYLYDVEYEEKWVQADFFNHIKNKPEYFINKTGVFVYVDKKDGKLFPIRTFRIAHSSVAGSILKLHLELLNFIEISVEDGDQNKNIIVKDIFLKYFGKKTIPPSPTGNYLLYGEQFYADSEISFSELSSKKLTVKENSNFDGFRNNVDDLVKSNFMHDSLHYHLCPNNVVIRQNNIESYYEIKAGKNFSIKIENYLPNYQFFESLQVSERNINISISKDCIELMGNDKYNCPKYGTNILTFKTKKIQQEELVIIKFHSEQREFKCANVELKIKILPLTMKETVISTFLSIGFLAWMNFGTLLANYNSKTGDFIPFQQIMNNFHSKDAGLNYPYISGILGWVLVLGLMTFWIVKTRILNTTIFRKVKL